jgi:Protein of unknown function (DUF3987)
LARILNKPWHEAFLDCVKPHTDAPLNFLTWSAISLIGAVLKNNVFFKLSTYTVYPNQYIILIAPPGIGKGTSMDIVENLINYKTVNQVVNLLSDRWTAEAMIEEIANGWTTPLKMLNQQLVVSTSLDHSCMFLSSELRTLLGASEWMLEFLEESWSKLTFNYSTKNKGKAKIEGNCFSLLGASVPDFLRNINREISMAITGGFSSRCLFIYAEEPSNYNSWIPSLEQTSSSMIKYKNLLADLDVIGQLQGEFKANTEAKILCDDYLKANRKVLIMEDSDAVTHFKARLKPHLLKLAMVLSASRGDSRIIEGIDMLNAIAEINKVQKNLELLFRGSGESDLAPATARVQTIIEKKGMVSRPELIKITQRHIKWEDLDRIMYVLETIGFVKKQTINKRDTWLHVGNGHKKTP